VGQPLHWKSLLLEAVKNTKPDLPEAKQFLHRAVDGLREAGTQHNLPWALFARATLYRYKKEFTLSWEDLEEAREIAVYGVMKLYLVDYYLEACRNVKEGLWVRDEGSGEDSGKGFFIIEAGERVELSVEGMKEKFREFLRDAESLIEDIGYHRRDGE